MTIFCQIDSANVLQTSITDAVAQVPLRSEDWVQCWNNVLANEGDPERAAASVGVESQLRKATEQIQKVLLTDVERGDGVDSRSVAWQWASATRKSNAHSKTNSVHQFTRRFSEFVRSDDTKGAVVRCLVNSEASRVSSREAT
jgi:hypothetical protein